MHEARLVIQRRVPVLLILLYCCSLTHAAHRPYPEVHVGIIKSLTYPTLYKTRGLLITSIHAVSYAAVSCDSRQQHRVVFGWTDLARGCL